MAFVGEVLELTLRRPSSLFEPRDARKAAGSQQGEAHVSAWLGLNLPERVGGVAHGVLHRGGRAIHAGSLVAAPAPKMPQPNLLLLRGCTRLLPCSRTSR